MPYQTRQNYLHTDIVWQNLRNVFIEKHPHKLKGEKDMTTLPFSMMSNDLR
jgi:hypothetical protein